MENLHYYKATVTWTGNKGTGTDDSKNYERGHDLEIKNKPTIQGSSDSAFKGDYIKHNPEDLLVSSLSACHMLWYLHLCSKAGVIVTDYCDYAVGVMIETSNGSGYFKEVTLNPTIVVADISMIDKVIELHVDANKYCFIANSVNFPVKHNPIVKSENK